VEEILAGTQSESRFDHTEMGDLAFDHYLTYEELTAILKIVIKGTVRRDRQMRNPATILMPIFMPKRSVARRLWFTPPGRCSASTAMIRWSLN